jgi:sugar lactone lactonase YvrE
VKARLLLLASLLAGGCGQPDPEAYLFMLDPHYRAEIAAGNDSGITSPDGLLWHDGGLIIADEGGSAVRYWRPGERVRTLATRQLGLRSPEDIVRDAAGYLYFTDDDAGGVRRIDPQGRTSWLAAPDQGLPSTEGLTLAPSGVTLAGDQRGHRIMAIAPDGTVRVWLGPEAGIEKPESMAFDDSGNLYVADNKADVLYLITRDGRVRRPISRREGFSPESLCYAGGTLYITDSHHGTLFRYSPETGLVAIAAFSGDLANIQGITADPEGNLYLSVQTDLHGGRGYILRLARR